MTCASKLSTAAVVPTCCSEGLVADGVLKGYAEITYNIICVAVLKKIVDGACEKMNPGLAKIAKKAEGLDADDGATQS